SIGRQVPSRQKKAVSQAVAQAPQFRGSLASSISQPSAASPLQSAKPAAHSQPQLPVEQSGPVLGGVGQALPQALQCWGEESRSTHSPEHSIRPDAQSGPESPSRPASMWPAFKPPPSGCPASSSPKVQRSRLVMTLQPLASEPATRSKRRVFNLEERISEAPRDEGRAARSIARSGDGARRLFLFAQQERQDASGGGDGEATPEEHVGGDRERGQTVQSP